MSLKLDDKVSWVELAPSVQNDFRNQNKNIINERTARINADKIIKGRIDQERIDMENQANEIKALISSLTGDSKEDPRLTKFINDNLVSDEPNKDKFVKVDKTNNTLFVDDNFRSINVVVNDTELSQMKNASESIIDLADVFNNWYRGCHYCQSMRIATGCDNWGENNNGLSAGQAWQNAPSYNHYKQHWTYTRSDQSIHYPDDQSPFCFFVNPKDFYTNYYLRVRVGVDDGDFIFLIVGYMVDSAGKEHTLAIQRRTNPNDNIKEVWNWCLVYDFDNPTWFVIDSKPAHVGNGNGLADGSGSWDGYHWTEFSVKRKDSYMEFKTSGIDTTQVVDRWTIKFDFPSTKPSAWPQEMYNNIKVMLTQTNRVGFGVCNQALDFKIVEQYELFDTGYIYALHTDQVWDFDFSADNWKMIGKCSEMLPNRIFLYNNKLWNFYFYYYPGKWQKISAK